MIKNMVKKICKATVVLPLLTLFCFAGFIGSLLIPNTVLDTYVINMTEEEGDAEVLLPLSLREPILYEMNTNGRSMKGIQIGIDKQNLAYSDAVLSYQVYVGKTMSNGMMSNLKLVSDNKMDLTALENVQYVYLPFDNYEAVNGEIQIQFWMLSCSEELLPRLIANHKEVKGTNTICKESFVDAWAMENDVSVTTISLKGNHIYTHETYPFLYDFRILSFLFLAVTMTLCFKKKEEATPENMDKEKKKKKETAERTAKEKKKKIKEKSENEK